MSISMAWCDLLAHIYFQQYLIKPISKTLITTYPTKAHLHIVRYEGKIEEKSQIHIKKEAEC